METLTIASCLRSGIAEREAYNAISANLTLTRPNGGVIAVTTPLGDATKSAATLGLAAALANAGRSILVIDGDLRTGALSSLCGVSSEHGLSSVLSGETSLENALLATDLPKLSLLASGAFSPDPTSLLSSDALPRLLLSIGKCADFVFIDTPAVLPTADGSLIAAAADCSILYVSKNSVSRRDLSAAKEQLDKSGHPTVGVIFSNTPERKPGLSLLSRLPFLSKKNKNSKE